MRTATLSSMTRQEPLSGISILMETGLETYCHLCMLAHNPRHTFLFRQTVTTSILRSIRTLRKIARMGLITTATESLTQMPLKQFGTETMIRTDTEPQSKRKSIVLHHMGLSETHWIVMIPISTSIRVSTKSATTDWTTIVMKVRISAS